MKSLFLAQQGCFLRYQLLHGEGPGCVYLHGLGAASSADFPSITANPLLSGYRFLLVDLLGFGFSDKPEHFSYTLEDHAHSVITLLDHHSYQGCALIGYSMGGSIAITAAAMRPDLVSRLVLIEANLDPGGGEYSKEIAALSEEEFCSSGYQALLETVRQEGLDTPSWAVYAGPFSVAAPLAVYRSAVGLTKGTSPTMRENLLAFQGSKAYIFGENSLPDEDVEYLAKNGVQVLIVPQAGHHMVYENPEGFAEALEKALR